MGFVAGPGETYKGPTLFLAGGRSDYVRPEHRPLIAELFPAASHAVIADAGHWVHAERPAEFLAELRHFLAAG
jgi:pimeloyl-ACP methyl ester carboxylesterase